MRALQPVRGTQDVLPETARRHRQVTEISRMIAERYGFAEMATPIFELTEVFSRPIGASTDIVTKEMYTFEDRGHEEITLRPENTAGIVRAVLSNGLTQAIPLKFFYSGPMFRYERPQKGRFRQFHQIGVELIGAAPALADVEVIALGSHILEQLGVGDRVSLEVNTLGDAASRAEYRQALVSYFSSHQSELSADSRRRLETNPLRILDSKDPGDLRIAIEAPSIAEYLSEESRHFFMQVRDGLNQIGIVHRLNPHLVRGLDYYTHTVFEFVTSDLGAQGTVLAGGRYDGLVELMGGPPLAGVGWAAGIERLAILITAPPGPARPVAVVPVGAAAEPLALVVAQGLRRHGWSADLAYSGSLHRRMRRANRINARAAILIGEDEVIRNFITLRDLDRGEQSEIPMDPAWSALRARLQTLYG
jgi:histidyl-tRNA synthetase